MPKKSTTPLTKISNSTVNVKIEKLWQRECSEVQPKIGCGH